MILAFDLCSSRSNSTVMYLLQSARGVFVSENHIVSHHPNGPTEKDEDVEGEINLQEGFPSLKDLWNCEVICKLEVHQAPTIFSKRTVEEQVHYCFF